MQSIKARAEYWLMGLDMNNQPCSQGTVRVVRRAAGMDPGFWLVSETIDGMARRFITHESHLVPVR